MMESPSKAPEDRRWQQGREGDGEHAGLIPRPLSGVAPQVLGAHYSPEPLVAHVVDRVLGPLGKSGRFGPDAVPAVLDPACGEGVFLRAAGRWLRAWLGAWAPDWADEVVRARVARSLHGVDRNPAAVQAAAKALGARGLGEARLVVGNSLLDARRDASVPAGCQPLDWQAAFGEVRAVHGFDAVVGNPPFVDAETHSRWAPEERRHLAATYATARGAWDLFCPFVERCVDLLAPGGRLGLILPNKLLDAPYAAATRALLADLGLEAVEDYTGVPLFQASVYPVVVVAWRPAAGSGDAERAPHLVPGCAAPPRCRFERAAGTRGAFRLEFQRSVPQAALQARAEAGWSAVLRGAGASRAGARRGWRLRPLGERCAVYGGATVSEAYRLQSLLREGAGGEWAEARAGTRGDSSGADRRTRLGPDASVPVVNTGTLDPHRVWWGERPMRYLGRRYLRPVVLMGALEQDMPRRAEQALSPKLILAGMTRRLECVFDSGCLLAAKSTVVVLLPRGPEGTRLGWFLAGLLNSRAGSERYARRYGGLALSGGYLRVGPPQIRAFPVPDPDEVPAPVQARVVSLASQLAVWARQGMGEADPRWRRATAQLDAACAGIYGDEDETDP